MRVRRIAELKRTQARMLEAIRTGQDAIVGSPITEAPGGGMPVLARVASVVAEHSKQGPHLIVARQTSSGSPPAFTDDPVPDQVVYPGPGRAVADYAIGEFVLCLRVDGAFLALKLA